MKRDSFKGLETERLTSEGDIGVFTAGYHNRRMKSEDNRVNS